MEPKIAVLFFVAVVTASDNSTEFVNEINKAQISWEAAPNEITRKGVNYMKRLLGARLPEDNDNELPLKSNNRLDVNLPYSFDARTKWPSCTSIKSIKNQGNCGSCWAVAVGAAATDRLCVKTGGKTSVNLSIQNLMSCCGFCIQRGTTGCDGGDPGRAWLYLKYYGLVTGGDYNSRQGCQPYEVPATQLLLSKLRSNFVPVCKGYCTNSAYTIPYSSDKHYGNSAYKYLDEITIMNELYNNGPLTAAMQVFKDFYYYKSGVYQRTSSEYFGGHAVRIIGWGVENGVKYWLVANSWGPNWGENGTFKIRRGNNECSFESYVTGGELIY